MITTGKPVRGLGSFSQPCFRLYEATVLSGANTATARSDRGYTLATWSSGKATLTLPSLCKHAILVSGTVMHNTDTAGDVHRIYAKSESGSTAGTLALSTISYDATPVTSDNPPDGSTVRLLLLVDEGAS